jgi:hypothetical protein
MNSSIPRRSGPAILVMALVGSPIVAWVTPVATSSAAIGWNAPVGRRTVLPSLAESAMALTNSKNWVARTMEYGGPDPSIAFSWATLARHP